MYSFIDIGNTSQETLVLIHGLGSKKESWAFQLELAEHFRVIVPDLRGHGESIIEEDISLKSFASDILALLDSLQITKAHFCGLSLGGIVAQEILRRSPDRVQSLILSNTSSYIPYSLGYMAVEGRRAKLDTLNDEDYERHVLSLCLDKALEEEHFEALRLMLFKINRNTYLRAANSVVGVNYTHTLFLNPRPTLVIGSLFDRITYYVNALTTNVSAPFSTLKTLTSASHVPHIEEPQVYNKLVKSFIHQL
ncbi:alpha/beta fold hydrolase [Alkalicoccobacillus porphyridii]|uniref:Alpha/beta hydrolase n=1 Tax=Alkalicoccobacillus porphyridii TaxID=2597270 RepID=A0A553ZYN9_9BACI|nr:alpha/beta hydrolase [Alkalicoccobacillus porphyridii]TSB46561.1 alpha/beta hydrolase [Alkalicoccobacillus porphyridii]